MTKKYINIVYILIALTYLVDAKTTRIMPLGDSITYDHRANDTRPVSLKSGYRNYLWYALQNANYEADFVGSRSAGAAVNPKFDTDNEGYPNWSSYQIAEYTYDYMRNAKPDIVLLHIGTNDRSPSVDGVEAILNEIDQYEKAYNKSVQVIVALIINRRANDDTIASFNKNLEILIQKRIKNKDKLMIVDMYHDSGILKSDYKDNTHPNDAGYNKMAQLWYKALTGKYDYELNSFPYTIADKKYIKNVSIDMKAKTVTFNAEVPNDGLIF